MATTRPIALILVILFSAAMTYAQETSGTSSTRKPVRELRKTTIGLMYLSWQESLKIEEAGITDQGLAQNSGQGAIIERQIIRARWGYGFFGGVSSGVARRGDFNNTTSYAETTAYWSALLGGGKIFWRLTPEIFLGLTTPILFRQVEWTNYTKRFTITPSNSLQFAAMIELKTILHPKWDLVQAIGPTYDKYGPLWKIGANYRF